MNIHKIEKQLKKISFLVETIKGEEEVSPIERDLLLSYVRVLYEKILEGATAQRPVETVRNNPLKNPSLSGTYPNEEILEGDAPDSSHEARHIAPNQMHQEDNPMPETVETPETSLPPELEEVFEERHIKELSDKLRMSPISDLTKCMGINEKIFTIQELFGNDKDAFEKTMSDLNDMATFDQAKKYLIDQVAIKYNWKDKIKKVDQFVQTINRRFV